MKAINIQLATFSFAAMLLASCSDSTSTDNSGIGKATTIVGTAVEKGDLGSRVVSNYKSPISKAISRAYDASKFDGINAMPEQPTIPSDAIDITQAPGNDYDAHTGKYIIKKSDKPFDTGNWNLQGSTIYVEDGATIDWKTWAPDATIYVLKGGKLISSTAEVCKQATVYNYGEIEFSQNTVVVSKPFYNAGSLNLTGKTFDVQNKCYIGGNLTAQKLNNNWGMTLYVVGDCTIEGNEELRLSASNLNIGGKFSTNGKMSTNSGALFVSACAINVDGDLDINSGSEVYVGFMKAKNITLSSGSTIVLKDKSMIDCEGTLVSNNQDIAKNYLEGENATAVIKANTITFNNGSPLDQDATKYEVSMFGTEGKNSKIVLDGIFKLGDKTITPVFANANIYPYTDENASDVRLDKTGCNTSGYKDDEKKEDPKPTLDIISTIDYDNHEHEISATGIQALNGHMYMSYHTRDKQHGGCIEVFSPVTNNKVTLEQYLYDKGKDLDFNHVLAVKLKSNERMVYLPGSSNNKGAMLAYIPIKDGGKLAEESEAITTVENGQEKVTYKEPLNFVQLNPATIEYRKAGYDENCVVYNDETNHLIVMTTKGYVVYDATTMNEVDKIEKPGKAKHVAIGNGKIVTLFLDRKANNVDEAIPATVEVFDQHGEDLNNPETTFSVSTIEPNNGKNVVAVKDNNIYVCRGAAGLYCYDIRGNEQWHYQMPSPQITVGDKAGTYKAYANGCYVGEKYVYIAYGSYGLVVLDKNTHEVVAHRQLTKSANYVIEYNGYIYVAYGKQRLQVFQLQNATPEVSYNE